MLAPPAKSKTKTIFIGKELKTKGLRQTAAARASESATKPESKPSDSRSREASQAAGAAPTLRYGPAGDSAPRLRLKASGMAESSLSARPHGRPPLSFPSRILGSVLTVKGTASPRLERTLGRSEGWLFKRERGGTAARWEQLAQTSNFATPGDSNLGKNAASSSQEIKCSANSGAATGQKHSGRGRLTCWCPAAGRQLSKHSVHWAGIASRPYTAPRRAPQIAALVSVSLDRVLVFSVLTLAPRCRRATQRTGPGGGPHDNLALGPALRSRTGEAAAPSSQANQQVLACR